jgi:hypothetical protein
VVEVGGMNEARLSRRQWLVGATVATLACAGAPVLAEKKQKDPVRVATLDYANGKTSRCFSAGFLDDVARQTKINIDREFAQVSLDSQELFSYPFVIMTGEGKFDLNDDEIRNLATFIKRGGFVLASAGCSSPDWTASFEKAIEQAVPKGKLKPLPMEHGLFHTIYDIDRLTAKYDPGYKIELLGLERDGKLVVLFSELGLNDTAHAGGDCCCCGGNELRDANRINANAVAYALTR